MNISDLRNNSRRAAATRRATDRRTIAYPFGSSEWQENIQKNYLAWPKTDRRQADRRRTERREAERRLQQLSEQSRSEQKYSHILLTREERKLIEDLYLYDLDETGRQ